MIQTKFIVMVVATVVLSLLVAACDTIGLGEDGPESFLSGRIKESCTRSTCTISNMDVETVERQGDFAIVVATFDRKDCIDCDPVPECVAWSLYKRSDGWWFTSGDDVKDSDYCEGETANFERRDRVVAEAAAA